MHQKIETFELKIAERCLKSQFFEKRVKGLNELKEIFFKIKNSSAKDAQEKVVWLNEQRFADWID